MARFPFGITPIPGADVDDVRTRIAQMAVAMDTTLKRCVSTARRMSPSPA